MEADYDVVILGAGAAGLAAGLYTTRAMMKTLLLEQLGPGGQLLITDEIENYAGFPDGINGQGVATKMETQTAGPGPETELPGGGGAGKTSVVKDGNAETGIQEAKADPFTSQS